MSDVVRLTLVSHAMTDAMSVGRFPADEPLNALGRRQLDDVDLGATDAAFCAPELRTRQTAEALGLAVEIEPRIADTSASMCPRVRKSIALRCAKPGALILQR